MIIKITDDTGQSIVTHKVSKNGNVTINITTNGSSTVHGDIVKITTDDE